MLCGAAWIAMTTTGWPADAPGKTDFNRQVRPLLADHCFKCHGADERQRKAKLRLDDRDAALQKKAFVPGKPDESELIKRLLTDDPEDVMPPPKEHRELDAAQKDLLRRWIAEGAEYQKHWAFIPPVKPAIPKSGSGGAEISRPIDAFISATLDELHLKPAAPAPAEQWLRRVTFALTGLPPTIEELDAFIADNTAAGREKTVERLLRSSTCAEHLAKDWLDAARYADSYGRHEDGNMTAWPWRDWVIKAFDQNLPYDQFITWQLAGDMLPKPARDQLVATAFNRLAQQSNESGNDPEEFRLDQVSDRVRASGMAFMGLTLECAKCHDHKYDPISQREYWQMAAFFDNIEENGVYSQFCPQATPSPSMLLPTPEQEKALIEARLEIAAREKRLREIEIAAKPQFEKWAAVSRLPGSKDPGLWNVVKSWFGHEGRHTWKPRAAIHLTFEKNTGKEKGASKELKNDANSSKPGKLRANLDIIEGPDGKPAMLFKGDDEVTVLDYGQELHRYSAFSFAVWLRPQEDRERAVVVCRSRGGIDDGRGFEVLLEHQVPSFALMHFQPGHEIRIRAPKPLPMNQWTHLAVTYDGSSRAGGMQMFINGRPSGATTVHDRLERDIVRHKEWGDTELEEVKYTIGGRQHDGGLVNAGISEFWAFRRVISPGEVKLLVGLEPTKEDFFPWWLKRSNAEWRSARRELELSRRQETRITDNTLEMMVMQDMPQRRPAFIRTRGDHRQRGEAVQPNVPQAVLPLPAGTSADRLGLAKWLTSPQHPLTSRVAVNRFWQLFFGRGLVGTPQDFGTRGELPSHPDLLDWLACDFMEHGWDVKRLCRMIALSSTFAQDIMPADPKALAQDPDNRWLSRGPQTRLSAEEIRDQALSCSGLLQRKVGGPSVRPYMPDGLYRESGLQQRYDQDTGEGLYRRSMYSFWRRTLPPPELAAFDAPSREFCVVKREQTHTPLQALVLLNGPQFVEAQRVMAESLLRRFPADEAARCSFAFRALTCRRPSEAEIAVMLKMLRTQHAHFAAHPEEAQDLGNNGIHPPDASLPAVDVAATTMVIRALMSHEETQNR